MIFFKLRLYLGFYLRWPRPLFLMKPAESKDNNSLLDFLKDFSFSGVTEELLLTWKVTLGVMTGLASHVGITVNTGHCSCYTLGNGLPTVANLGQV